MTENNNKSNYIPDNVLQFVEKCADIVAYDARHDYLSNSQYKLKLCESPIEQLFIAAFTTLVKINNLSSIEISITRHTWVDYGISVSQQHKIGKYRVDFLITYSDGEFVDDVNLTTFPINKSKKIIVELDGHKFHDKNERQRRYEKQRDRFFATRGYHVFHFTGSEVVKDPFNVAAECLAYLTGDGEDDSIDKEKEFYLESIYPCDDD